MFESRVVADYVSRSSRRRCGWDRHIGYVRLAALRRPSSMACISLCLAVLAPRGRRPRPGPTHRRLRKGTRALTALPVDSRFNSLVRGLRLEAPLLRHLRRATNHTHPYGLIGMQLEPGTPGCVARS